MGSVRESRIQFSAICAIAVLAASIAGATACTVGSELSPGSPNGQVANSCSIIDPDGTNLTYGNFAYTIETQTAGSTQALSITYGGIVSFAGGDLIINFNPNLVNNGNNQGIYDIHFAYEVTGGTMGASITDNGVDASIGESNCTTGTAGNTSGACTGTLLWSVNAGSVGSPTSTEACGPGATQSGGSGTSVCNYGGDQPVVWVFKNIEIGVSTSGGVTVLNSDDDLTSFNEDNLAVPEPMTLSLVGAGLLGLGLLRKRMPRR